MTPQLLTAQEVADRLQVPDTWVYRAARERQLPSVCCGRYRRFVLEDVESWIARQREATTDLEHE
jgi:excisionase family DNA binding protein